MTSKGQVNETSVHVNRDNKRKQCLGEKVRTTCIHNRFHERFEHGQQDFRPPPFKGHHDFGKYSPPKQL